jgi:hypothetical protein
VSCRGHQVKELLKSSDRFTRVVKVRSTSSTQSSINQLYPLEESFLKKNFHWSELGPQKEVQLCVFATEKLFLSYLGLGNCQRMVDHSLKSCVSALSNTIKKLCTMLFKICIKFVFFGRLAGVVN